MGFNPRDFMTVEQAQKQSMQPMQTSAPPAPTWTPQYVGNEAYSTTVMPETGEPGPNVSLAGNRNYATMGTANDLAKLYGGRVLQANIAKGPTTTNAAQLAIDFGPGTGDPLNAGLLAARYDTSNPNRDKFWDSAYWRDKALQDELNYASRYNPTAQNPREGGAFVGPANSPNYQWHVPQGGADYLSGGKAPIASAKLNASTGAGIGMPGQSAASAATPKTNMQSGLYGKPATRPAASPYGSMAPTQTTSQLQRPVVSAYRPVGMGKTF